MKLHTLLLFGLLAIFSSCNGQNTDQVANGQKSIKIGATGDTVSEVDKCIWYIFQDKNNDYWFGSNGQGVYHYDGKAIIHFSNKDGLCNGQVRGIQEDSSGNIYINTVSGISKFNGHTFATLPISKSTLPDSGWRLRSGDLWFQGAQDSGVVYRYDGTSLYRLEFPKTKAGNEFVSKYPRSEYPQMNYSPYDAYSIFKDSKGNVWFGTNMGVCRYNGKTFAWISEKELGIDAIAIHVRSTFEDRDGNFWFGNIMHRFNVYPNAAVGTGNGSISFKVEKGLVDSKDHDGAYFMSSTEDNKGDLWMVTYSKGVWRYDGKKLTQYVIKDGNENVTLFSIYKDRKGDLWLGTHTAGVYKFNGTTFEKFRFVTNK